MILKEYGKINVERVKLLCKMVSLLTILALFAGCAGSPKKAAELVWPPPPETPRIKFLRTISAASDADHPSMWKRVRHVLFGPEPEPTLAKPYWVFPASDGRVYVADTGWSRVLVFDYINDRFFMIGVDGPGALAKPQGVTADRAGRIYVTDTVLRRCLVYDHDGNFLFAIGDLNRFERPVGVAVNNDLRRIYISDTRKHKIMAFDFEGNFLRDIGQRGSEDGEFNFPAHLFVDREGKIYVTDLNFRVQIFDADGKFLSKFGSVGTGIGQFSMPKGVGVDSQGHIYVVDARFNNVQVFDQQGRVLLFFGEMGTGPGQFWLPAGLSIDSEDRIYIADQYNRRIDVFQYIGPKELSSNDPRGEP